MKNIMTLTSIAIIVVLSILYISCERNDTGFNTKQEIIDKENALLEEKILQKSLISDSIKQLSKNELIEYEKQVLKNFKEGIKANALNPNSIKRQEIVIHKYIGINNYNRLSSDLKEKVTTDIINKFVEIDTELKSGINKNASIEEMIEFEKAFVSERENKRHKTAKEILDIYL